MTDLNLSDLTRASLMIAKAVCDGLTRGDPASTRMMLEERFGPRSPLLTKTAIPAMTTGDGLVEARLDARAFLTLVGKRYAFEALPFLEVPPNVVVPVEQQEAVATRISEGAAIAVAARCPTFEVVSSVRQCPFSVRRTVAGASVRVSVRLYGRRTLRTLCDRYWN